MIGLGEVGLFEDVNVEGFGSSGVGEGDSDGKGGASCDGSKSVGVVLLEVGSSIPDALLEGGEAGDYSESKSE